MPLLVVQPLAGAGGGHHHLVDVPRLAEEVHQCDNSVHADCREEVLGRYRKTPARTVSHVLELVDLFPTIVDLLHLPALLKCDPSTLSQLCTDGR